MKVLLTGSTGQLGQEILISKPKDVHLIAPKRSELDLTENTSCEEFIIENKPDWVINCAAFKASLTPFVDKLASTHPVNLFSAFHLL